MLSTRIAIVGGGLSGLYTAFRLEQAGIGDYRLFEARDGFGGRILSASLPDALGPTSREVDRFDLGPTWFWPDMQPQLDRLFHDLGLPRFAQHEAGDMVVERSRRTTPTDAWLSHSHRPHSHGSRSRGLHSLDPFLLFLSPSHNAGHQQQNRKRARGRHDHSTSLAKALTIVQWMLPAEEGVAG